MCFSVNAKGKTLADWITVNYAIRGQVKFGKVFRLSRWHFFNGANGAPATVPGHPAGHGITAAAGGWGLLSGKIPWPSRGEIRTVISQISFISQSNKISPQKLLLHHHQPPRLLHPRLRQAVT